MARLTLILGVLATVIYLLDGFRFMLNEWRNWRNKGTWIVMLAIDLLPSPAQAVYDLPNNDGDCPANCRQISWLAGSDVWNGGTLPVYTGIDCTVGLVEEDGTTDNTVAIENCLAAIADGQASVLPAGMYYVSGSLDIPSNKVLRGRGSRNCSQGTWITASWHGDTVAGGTATCTTIKLGDAAELNPAGTANIQAATNLLSGYTKGSTVLTTVAAPGYSTGDWIVISELEDPAIPSDMTGFSGECTFCGEENLSARPMTQIVKVESVSGDDITISRPLYYTFLSALTPRVRRWGVPGEKVGIESMKIWHNGTGAGSSFINIQGCMLCWVKDVETYNALATSGAFPIYMKASYGNEVRDSYFHFGVSNASGQNYGIGMFGPNSDHKIENNIYRENRHAFSQEGGGSGNVFLYNYVDDMWTSDATYVGRTVMAHGSHPYMTLVEGNIVSHYGDDNVFGSSSHNVLFRNWFWGDETGDFTTWGSVTWGFVALEMETNKTHMSVLGNILGGTASIQNYPGHVTWNTGTVLSTACDWGATGSNSDEPHAYGFGCNSGSGTYDSAVRSTAILHGNYDYKTVGIADWDGGADHTIKDSYYYNSKPSFFGTCAWPPFDGTKSPPTNTSLPARERYAFATTCDQSPATSAVVIGRMLRWMEVAAFVTGMGWHFRKQVMAVSLAAIAGCGTLYQLAPRSYETLKVVSKDSTVKVLTVFNHITKRGG